MIEVGQVALVGGQTTLGLVTRQHGLETIKEVHIAAFPGSSILMGRPGPSKTGSFSDRQEEKTMTSKSPASKSKTPTRKSKAKNAAARKAVGNTKKKTGAATAPSTPQSITAEMRHQMIAEAAFFISQQHGFQSDDAMADWLKAEAEIDARLLAGC